MQEKEKGGRKAQLNEKTKDLPSDRLFMKTKELNKDETTDYLSRLILRLC